MSHKTPLSVWIFLILLVGLPVVTIFIGRSLHAEWIGRLWALIIFHAMVLGGLVWLCLTPQIKISEHMPWSDRAKKIILYCVRLTTLVLTAAFLFFLVIPFSMGIADLVQGGSPMTLVGLVTDVSTTNRARFISSRITVKDKIGSHMYQGLFWIPVREGEEYRFMILKYAGYILEAQPLKSAQ